MRRGGLVFWGAVLAQALFLLGWAGYHEWVRQNAPSILLKAGPVDPRDLIRGDYMILAYDISQVPPPAGKPEPGIGSDLWVVLEKRGSFHEAVRTSTEPPEVGPGQVLARGTVGYQPQTGKVRVEYGIEQYFVPEGKGTPRFEEMVVRASVGPDQRLYIREMLLDGKPYP